MRLPFHRLPKRVATSLLVAIALVSGALAYFTTTGSGSASGTVTTLSAPASPAASASGTTATITWNASTIGGSVAAGSYTVERYSSSGTDLGAAGCSPVSSASGSPNAFGSFTCADSPGGGSFKYKITAHYHSSWTATTAFTSTVSVQSSTSTSASGPATDATNTAIATSSISSTLSGGIGATGTITFKVFGPQASAPSTCTSGGTTVGTAAVSGNATYHPSAGYTPASAGTYWWYASYGGDSGNTASASTCGSGMSSTVVKNATADTASAPATGNAGSVIAASSIGSTLSGATAGASGTITFTVFGPQTTAPSTCTSGGTTVGTATVSGNGAYTSSASFTPSTVGTYWWYASYPGDSNNSASNSTCGSGMTSTVVAKANAALTAGAPATDATGTAIATGSITATLSGATSGAGGTVTFTVFGPQASAPTTCTSGGTTVGTATVSGNGTYNPSAGYTPATAGTYWWYVSYGGDSNNNTSASTCGSGMTSTAVKNTTSILASGPATGTSGTAIATGSISSTLSGATSGATGTITFTVFGPQTTAPSSCTSGGTTVGTATVSGNATYHPSAGFTPSSAGVYWWYASYNGDGNNSASSSLCGSPIASTYVYSVSSAASGTITTGTSVTTTSFTVQPSTTYLLLVFRHSSASDSISSISSTGLSPALTLPSFTSVTSQTYNTSDYQWAYYVTTSSSASGTGTLTVNFANTLSGTETSMVDLVALGGVSGTNPIVTGNEALTSGSGTAATANLTSAPASIDSSLVFLSANKGLGASAPAASPAMTNAFYSQNSAGTLDAYTVTPGSQNESFTITSTPWGSMALELRRAGSANSTTTTANGPASGSAGTAISAGSISAALSGSASGAGGTITYTVFGPQASAPTTCTSGGTTVGTATASGNGTYNPSAGYTPALPGTYWWYASYGGDANNLESTSTCGSGMASTAVGNATTTLTMSSPAAADLSGTAIAAGSIGATLSNGVSSPSGTITYTVFGPQATAPTTCTSGGTTVGTSSVSGNGAYTSSAALSPSSAGTYWWYASYNGDSNNNAATSTCGAGMASTYVYSASSAASVTATTGSNAVTSSFTVQPSTTYLLLVYRSKSGAGDGITSLSSTSLSPALTLASFTSITSQSFNSKDYEWAYWITTASNASGTGTLTLNFTNTLGAGQATIMDLIQLGGVSTTAPVVTSNEITSTANSGTATANLPNAPAAGDLGLVLLGSEKGQGTTAPAPSPAMTNIFYSQQGAGSMAPYAAAPAAQNESITLGTSGFWGTIGLELQHP